MWFRFGSGFGSALVPRLVPVFGSGLVQVWLLWFRLGSGWVTLVQVWFRLRFGSGLVQVVSGLVQVWFTLAYLL